MSHIDYKKAIVWKRKWRWIHLRFEWAWSSALDDGWWPRWYWPSPREMTQQINRKSPMMMDNEKGGNVGPQPAK